MATITDEIIIEKLSHDGRGIAHINGKITFIANALPGETVEIKYLARKGKFNEAIAININTKNNNRVEPQCQFYQACGGCSLQHLSHSAQLAHKQLVLKEHLEHFGKIKLENYLQPITGPQYHYRHKARLGGRYVAKKNKLLLGFREKNNKYIADMTSCPILPKAIYDQLEALQDLLGQTNNKNKIPQVEIAVDDNNIVLLIRHLDNFTEAELDAIKHYGKQNNFIIYLQPKGPNSIHLLYPEKFDYLNYQLPDFDLTLKFKPTDFTQINPEINKKMLNQAITLLDLKNTDTVLDLFCGLGNFSLPMATKARFVTGIEGSDDMVQRATMNSQENNISNTKFYKSDLSELDPKALWVKNYNKLLLDPPRSGALEIVNNIEKFNPERLVYVSCNPATFSRDADILVHEKGYTLETAGIMDMFPHTSHVEAMGVFSR